MCKYILITCAPFWFLFACMEACAAFGLLASAWLLFVALNCLLLAYVIHQLRRPVFYP